MQIYVSRNNQQSGPFEEAQVLDMLRIGQLSPNDFGLPHGAVQWHPLGEIFRISAPQLPINYGIQHISDWARQNLSNQLFVRHKSAGAELKGYLIALILVGVLPFFIGLILKTFLSVPPIFGLILMLIGGILFFVLALMFGLIFVVNHFRKKNFAAVFNSQGVVSTSNVLYDWDKLQHINFLKIKNQRVHGQGLLVSLVSSLLIVAIRRAILKDPRQRLFDGAELVFASGKVILPTTMTNFAEVWDFIEKVPAQARFDGRFGQNTAAELQSCGLYNKPQNPPAAALLTNPQQSPPLPVNQMSANLNAPTAAAAKNPNAVWVVAAVLIGGFLLLGVGGTFASYFLFSTSSNSSSSTGNRGENSNTSSAITANEGQTFQNASPDKKTDFAMTAEDFYLDAGDYSKEKQALAKYKDKTVEIAGRAYLFQNFDGKNLFFRTTGAAVGTELLAGEASKLTDIKDGERVKVRCEIMDDFGVKLKNCAVLERKPVITADEKPDFSITAKEYWEQVENSKLSYETRQKNRTVYFGKVLEISGKIQKIASDGHFLSVSDRDWVTCTPDEENKPLFANLTEGQEIKFKGVDDGISLTHCIISR